MTKTILIDRLCGETCLALLEDGALCELYFESRGHEKLAGNIYLGRVENVLPGMNAAFVNIGLEKNAFLYAGDIQIDARADAALAEQLRGARIEKLVRPGQSIMVQVVKEPGGDKGPRVSCHITLPGRLAVLLPTVNYIGVSRRIADEAARARLRAIAEAATASLGCGAIVRTAAQDADEAEILAEFDALKRLWENTRNHAASAVAPALLHRDDGLVERAVRDMLSAEVESVRTDDPALHAQLLETAATLAPQLAGRIVLDRADMPIFDRFCVLKQAETAFRRRVWLKSGGYLVIDYTEALTVIDVNTGKYVGKRSLTETIFQINCEAAREIARQLRLRDIGGIIVIDFIDMDSSRQREALLEALRDCLREDRTHTNLAGMTGLGLVEMTRKKVRQPIYKQKCHVCPVCQGGGLVPLHDFTARQALYALRRRRMAGDQTPYLIVAAPPVAGVTLAIGAPEVGGTARVLSDASLADDEFRLEAYCEERPPEGARLLKVFAR
ncbi:MAG TPA: Rne/Rng family ribonuclease [Candidatus Pullichristensenella avicola]|nr:Rne/Rng family ribonuclease [Candidatus Pullichristensenella avicola]